MAALNTTVMEYNIKTYFEEKDDESVKGFSVIDVNQESEQYRIAEKWVRDTAADTWVQYWIPEERLLERVSLDKCAPKGSLSADQYQKIKKLV